MRIIRAIATTLALLILVYGVWYGYHTWHRAKQISTTSRLQAIAGLLVQSAANGGRIKAEELKESVESVAQGRDSWGNTLFFYVDRHGSWVVISGGKDGRLNLPRIEDYLLETPLQVHGDYDRDIFFRDGKSIWSAGN